MTARELWKLCHEDDDLEPVFQEIDDDWRHGSTVNQVFQIGEEFWSIWFRRTPDSDYHGWREGDADDPVQVWPKEVKTIIYITEKPNV